LHTGISAFTASKAINIRFVSQITYTPSSMGQITLATTKCQITLATTTCQITLATTKCQIMGQIALATTKCQITD
jgi:hypothetical protein